MILLSTVSLADVPGLISYQGTLTSDNGVVMDTTISITFAIYEDSTGGSPVPLWWETQSAVNVTNSVFNVLLGRVNSIPDTVFNNQSCWLSLQIGSDPAMEPRQRIVAVGYAFQSAEADTADYAFQAAEADTAEYAHTSGNGGASSGWVDDGNIVRLETTTDSVGIGTIVPQEIFHVNGKIRVESSSISVSGTDMFFIPSGVIVMWSGSLASIPSGWALCDGSNGTPDLRERFVYGCSVGEDPGETGGSTSHQHIIPFAFSGNSIYHFNSSWGSAGPDEAYVRITGVSDNSTQFKQYTSGSYSGGTSGNLPPYYKLAFIMKL
jgi:hypothetical protein